MIIGGVGSSPVVRLRRRLRGNQEQVERLEDIQGSLHRRVNDLERLVELLLKELGDRGLPLVLKCGYCGWYGGFHDASVTHMCGDEDRSGRVEYRCPKCERLLASHMRFDVLFGPWQLNSAFKRIEALEERAGALEEP